MYDYDLVVPEGYSVIEKKLAEIPTINKTSIIRKSSLGSWTDIGPRVQIAESVVGDYTYFAGDASVIYSEIGKFCSIASHVRINPGNHPKWRVMQHHCTYRKIQYGFDTVNDEEFFEWRRKARVEIGHDVWLGHGVIVMPGIKIGTGAVIGSGSVVTKDIPPYSIAVGVPARVIKIRFETDSIEKIMQTQWWNWDRQTMEERLADFYDPAIFIEKYS